MIPRETSKQRSLRIPLDYARRPDRLARAKFRLSVAAAVLTLWWLSGLGWDVRLWSRRAERSREMATHGPLAKPHAAWDTSCDACHVPFTPIDGSSWAARFVDHPRESETRCRSCHAGHAHNANESPIDSSTCASCHRDHRGREASLVAVADQECTRCHAALDGHIKPDARPSFAVSVTGFDSDSSRHPEFALSRNGPANDPGRLKFNHALHMTPGFNPEPEGRPIETLADLPPADRETYRPAGSRDDEPVRLRCDSCHQPDAGGSYMRPIRYEKDCRACHPLHFDPSLLAVRHGLQPAELHDDLWQRFSAHYLKDRPDLPISWSSSRPVPGREETPELKIAREAIGQAVAGAERVLYGEKKCLECHTLETPDGRPVAPMPPSEPRSVARIAVPNVPGVWFPHAAFNHRPHRAFDCRGCHARAYPDAPAASHSANDVLIPGAAVCRTCHAPPSAGAGGAGYSCTECHRYHHDSADRSQRPAGTPTPKEPARRAAASSYTQPDSDLVAYLSWLSTGPAGAVVRRP
jgi:predicted CXXCH cytochrome family protein